MSSAVNVARSTRSGRRSKAAIDQIRGAIYATLEADHPMTVRQVFYRLVSRGAIEKTEAEYNRTVGRLLTDMRRAGQIPFDWIADNTRWMRKPTSYSSLADMLAQQQQFYRRALWDDQNTYVEIWLEKDALAGVLYEETKPWDVPLMVTRGYPSVSYLHGAAMAIRLKRKPAHLYYFGDHDPSGRDITRATEKGLREFAPNADIRFERVAVNEQQIRDLRLPTRPTKKTDSRSKGFHGESVEVDAIPAATLRALARRSIERHIDRAALEGTRQVERAEREALNQLTVHAGPGLRSSKGPA